MTVGKCTRIYLNWSDVVFHEDQISGDVHTCAAPLDGTEHEFGCVYRKYGYIRRTLVEVIIQFHRKFTLKVSKWSITVLIFRN